MTKKTTLLTLGSIAAVSVPVIAVVSCGTENPSQTQIRNKQLIESQAMMDKIELQWQKQVIKSYESTYDESTSLWTSQSVKDAFDFVIKRHVMKDSNFLITTASSLMGTQEMRKIVDADSSITDAHALATKWKLLEYRENGDMTPDVLPEGKEFLFNNVKSLQAEVIKHAISNKFLSTQMTKDEYKTIYMEENDKFNDIQGIIDSADFYLINQAIEQHLFAQWSVSLSPDKSLNYLSTTAKTDTVANLKAAMANTTTGFAKDALYSTRIKVLVDGIVEGSNKSMVGFTTISPYKGTRGQMELNKDGLKKATDFAMWNGFIQNDDILNQDSDKVDYFPNKSKQVSFKYVMGLLPKFANGKLTFDSYAGKDKLINLLSESSTAYSDAVKYLTTRKTNPIKLEIKSDELRKAATEHGFTFIKEN